MASPAGSSGDLDRLIRESEESIKRLEKLQKRPAMTWGERFAGHFRLHGNHLVAAMLAGSIFVVALGRLSQKYEHQAEKEAWEAQRSKLLQERAALLRQVAAVDTLAAELEQATASVPGTQLAARVVQLLQAHRRQQADAQGETSVAASAGGGVNGEPNDAHGGSPPQLMI